ncbi:hypothetical protein [Cystobacter fuscus]|uniref:hypothetical protein n=1 Tax=Cystobacter fuscus TaxID=43 RepID=UPI002B318D44|nr:hypothetical protein F0U63_16280 [Cystobacter fuscus]
MYSAEVAPMSFQFDVQVQNKTGQNINSVSIAHYCNDNTNAQVFQNIPDGISVPVGTVTTYSGHKDYYGGQFVMGGDFYQFNCYCSIDSGDTAVTIILNSNSYTIQYSSNGTNTDSCQNKSYDYTTA